MTKSTPKTKTPKKASSPMKAKTVAKKPSIQKKSVSKKTGAAPKGIVKKTVAKKTVIKPTNAKTPKTVVKKPSVQKKAALKTTVKTSKAATPKVITAEKTPIPKKAPIARTSKAVVKPRSVQKKTISKKAATTPKKMAKSTKEDIRQTLKSLESRMKRADTLTRKSVKALESAVMTLDARARKDNSTSKGALTRKVNALSAKLTAMVEKTQSDVTAELKTALTNPTADNLQGALLRAESRMSNAEHMQAAAITKVNRHLASIANAVDKRIEDERRAREDAIVSVKQEAEDARNALTTRLETVEKDTAEALSRVGDKITELSSELTQRGHVSELSIREKVSEIALQTQTEFETYRAGLEGRIDNVVANTNTQDTQRLEHMLAGLTARLEGLEHAVSAAPTAHQAPDANDIKAVTQQPAPSQPHLSVVQSQPLTAGAPTAIDAFTPLAALPSTPSNAMPNPYLVVETDIIEDSEPEKELHIPVEFDPRNYVTQQKAPEIPAIADVPIRDFTETPLATTPPPLPLPEMNDLRPMVEASQTVPYADPAYAEADSTMAKLRINTEEAPKFNLPKLSGRNLRVAALATGVAVVGLVAAKGVFGGDAGQTPNTQQTAQRTQPEQNVAPISIPQPDTSTAPIGDYADNKVVELASDSEEAKTLNSAAAAGDAVAQFQLGLSYLEQGRSDEGVSLIRKSANQNQPAAQYRLAKLYESGEGISQDAEMARQLTERAARNGNRIAMHDLALYYAEGRGGVEANLPVAAKWFEKAAERGVVDSQFNLGVLFESGQGIPKNMNDAFVWYSIAAAQGDQFAKTRVDILKDTLEQADLVKTATRIKNFKPRKIDETANGIFKNVAWGKSAKDAGKDVSQIKQVQTMLSDLGYDIGGADGAVGPKTRAAIMSFERSNSLPETGRVNTALLDRLELATGA